MRGNLPTRPTRHEQKEHGSEIHLHLQGALLGNPRRGLWQLPLSYLELYPPKSGAHAHPITTVERESQDLGVRVFFNGAFNYDVTPVAPLGTGVITLTKPSKRLLWQF